MKALCLLLAAAVNIALMACDAADAPTPPPTYTPTPTLSPAPETTSTPTPSASATLNADKHIEQGIAYNDQSFAYYDKGDYAGVLTANAKALDAFNKVIELDPNHPYALYALYNQGLVYHEIGDFEDAIAAFRQVLKNNPNDADAYYNLGNAYYEIGEEDKANTSYGKAAELRSQ